MSTKPNRFFQQTMAPTRAGSRPPPRTTTYHSQQTPLDSYPNTNTINPQLNTKRHQLNSKALRSQLSNALRSQLNSKRPISEMEPRVTRGMKKMANSTTSGQQKCAICLGDCQKETAKLTCGHKFCQECIISWWRQDKPCPCCRLQIDFIETNSQKRIRFEDLPKEEEQEEDDQKFIPKCKLCWHDIEPHQPINICTQCRAVYWHRSCLPFSSETWHCVQCAGQDDSEAEY